MSDIDDMLKGSDDQGPASQANVQGQGTELEDKSQGQQSPEEVEFSKLSGNAQERIRKLVNRATSAEQKAAELEASRGFVPPAPTNFQSPDNQAAVKALEDAGIATDRKVDEKLNSRLNQVMWNFEQARLESKYTGADGTPKYDRAEVEDYMRSNPTLMGYAPEDVFRFKMFPDEFLDVEVKQRGGSQTKGSSSLKPTRASEHEETLTPEYISEMTDIKKVGREAAERFYDEHREEIQKVLKQMVPLQ